MRVEERIKREEEGREKKGRIGEERREGELRQRREEGGKGRRSEEK